MTDSVCNSCDVLITHFPCQFNTVKYFHSLYKANYLYFLEKYFNIESEDFDFVDEELKPV